MDGHEYKLRNDAHGGLAAWTSNDAEGWVI